MTSTAVNRPTDTKVKERDINNKLQLYGIFTGEWHSPRLVRHWVMMPAFVAVATRPV